MAPSNNILIISEDARGDYDNIIAYSAETWGASQAAKYDRTIDRALRGLSDHAYRGRPRDELFLGCRSLLTEHHLIYYEVIGSTIHIIRILHERSDPYLHVHP